jgi:hypothetical protein
MLAAGDQDDFPNVSIFTNTQRLAAAMAFAPGTSLFITDTGHSIHNERPVFFANSIVQFLLTPWQSAGGSVSAGTGTGTVTGTAQSGTGAGTGTAPNPGTGTGTAAAAGTGTGNGPQPSG